MAVSMKNLDPAFQSVGQKVGLEIWRIENFAPVPVPKSDYGKFYSGDSYIVLQTTATKSGAYQYDVHFWLGKATSQDEAGTAAIKTVELDAALGGRAVQYRELQGFETDKFLSYFKPCIIPLEGGVASGFKTPEEDTFEPRLYVCRGRHVVRVKQVAFARTSLNHDDVFILDTETKVYQFNGVSSNIQERAKALEVVQYIKDTYHKGTCDVAVIEDGKLVAESDSGEFWSLFGGYAPIGKKGSSDDDIRMDLTAGKLYCIEDGELKPMEGPFSKSMLESNKSYILDCGAEVYVWVGRLTQLEDRKSATKIAEDFLSSQNRPRNTQVTRVIQGFEPLPFRENFESWPLGGAASSSEDGRGKVAALLKQQGVKARGMLKGTSQKEDTPPLLEENGKLDVWRVKNTSKTPIPKEEIGKFYSGDCYIVLYTYHQGDRKEDYYLCSWLGKQSTQEDQAGAARISNTMCNSLRGRPVQGRILEGKEPPQFIALFSNMVILKGGLSVSYKKCLADNEIQDDTYSEDAVALIQVSGTAPHNSKSLQVDPVAESLNSSDVFLLQTSTSFFIWHGNSSTLEQQQLATSVAEFLKPSSILKLAKEGTEPGPFWNALGGKKSYQNQKKQQESTRDPHLYACTFDKGILRVSEIFNFAQDDLLTEDIMILDTYGEVFVWIGQNADPKEKQQAFEIGQKYMERAALLEGLSPETPLYKVTEGNEPSFFTKHFIWDLTKATIQGNSFEKKIATLQGISAEAVERLKKAISSDNSSEGLFENAETIKGGGPTQRAAAMAALNSAFKSVKSNADKGATRGRSPIINKSSQRAAAVAALSSVLSAEPLGNVPPAPPVPRRAAAKVEPAAKVELQSAEMDSETKLETESTAASETEEAVTKTEESVSDDGVTSEESSQQVDVEGASKDVEDAEKSEENGCTGTFTYEQLVAKSTNPAQGIDPKKRETYLSSEEFQKVFGMDREKFYAQPKWKQDLQKRSVDMF